MTPRSRIWILNLFWIAAPVAADPCFLPASEWLREPAVGKGFAGKNEPILEGSARREMDNFLRHFDKLFGERTEKLSKERAEVVRRWAEGLGKTLELPTQESLAKALRRWTGVYFRDTVPAMEAATAGLSTRKFAFFERALLPNGPPLSRAFCLDEELSDTPEGAKKTRADLMDLKNQREELEEFSGQMEQQYVQRIRQNPAAGDRFLPYAAFLFSVGRLDDAEDQLRQAKALAPKLKGLAELGNAIEKARGIADPVDRARFIRAVVTERRNAAETVYHKSHQRLPKASAPEEAGTSTPTSPIPVLPRKRE